MSIETLFRKIYELAFRKDEQGLMTLIKEGYSLNPCRQNYTPAELLAKDKYCEAVEVLINLRRENLNCAVKGYATGRHVTQVENLITRGASLDFAIQGYARGRHVTQVESLITRGGVNVDYAVHGYAIGGHVTQVENLLTRGANRDAAAYGYARGGHITQVENLLTRGVKRDHAVIGYAIGGHVSQVENLLTRGATRDVAAKAYAAGGHITQVENLITRGASLNIVANGYAKSGFASQVEDLLTRGANLDDAIRGFAQTGHVAQGESKPSCEADLNSVIIQGYELAFKCSDQTLAIFSSTDDERIRGIFAKKAKLCNDSLDIGSLLQKASRINYLRKEYRINYEQSKALMTKGAIAWLLYGINTPSMQRDVFFYISSILLNLSFKSTQMVFSAVNKKHPRSLSSISNTMTFFQTEKDNETGEPEAKMPRIGG